MLDKLLKFIADTFGVDYIVEHYTQNLLNGSTVIGDCEVTKYASGKMTQVLAIYSASLNFTAYSNFYRDSITGNFVEPYVGEPFVCASCFNTSAVSFWAVSSFSSNGKTCSVWFRRTAAGAVTLNNIRVKSEGQWK